MSVLADSVYGRVTARFRGGMPALLRCVAGWLIALALGVPALAAPVREGGPKQAPVPQALQSVPQPSRKHIAIDADGTVYISDTSRCIVYRVASTGETTLVAGATNERGYRDGRGRDARFFWPGPMAFDQGRNLYVADRGNRVIRKISPAGLVSTVAGHAGEGGDRDGPAAQARIHMPKDVVVAPDGSVVFAEFSSIRSLSTDGVVRTILGRPSRETESLTPAERLRDGAIASAYVDDADGVAYLPSGELVFSDSGFLRVVGSNGVVKRRFHLDTVKYLGRSPEFAEMMGFVVLGPIVTDREGHIYTATPKHGEIWRISPDFRSAQHWLGSESDPAQKSATPRPPRIRVADIAIDRAGRLVAVDLDRDVIYLVNGQRDAVVLNFRPPQPKSASKP